MSMDKNRDIFSKYLPNVKLSTRYDAEGREVQVERREDADAITKEEETFEMLVAAGYYRAKIKGLSAFDKIIGGMTWCIECCEYDVDVDLLFHENLTIGQKIALVEKIVAVLPQMKCPFLIEPHQIQGLEFLSIHPVIQWLVKRSVENRTERSQRLKKFAIGQFHNHYQYKTDKENLAKIRAASERIRQIQDLYHSQTYRQYKRIETSKSDERINVQNTLSEYGHQFILPDTIAVSGSQKLLNNVLFQKDNTVLDKTALHKHYTELKQEMETDAKELSEQSQLKSLETTKLAFERKLARTETENIEIGSELEKQRETCQQSEEQLSELKAKVLEFQQIETESDVNLLSKVKSLLDQHDKMKKEDSEFKEQCRNDLAKLQQQIDDLSFDSQNPKEQVSAVAKDKARMNDLKLQLAKRNRSIVSIQRQLDAIPDRTELTQYQRRFHELYFEMTAKHLETKQYFNLFNTLNDKKCYLEKELSLLNSICDAYNVGMMSTHGREEFIKQFETILEGVKQTESKVRLKYNEERQKRDGLNDELQRLLDLQRQYAAAVKHLRNECHLCEELQIQLKTIQSKK